MANPDADEYDLVIAGGGAAGFFAAITCAEASPGARILILEKARRVLGKVKISGGGRCNVTNGCQDPHELHKFYPRGSKQLLGPFHKWGPAETMAWFEDHGVPLKVEADHRVFPQSDNSQTIINCLTHAANKGKIEVRKQTEVTGASMDKEGWFVIAVKNEEPLKARHLILTLGGIRNSIGASIATKFGHRIQPAAPSLFTFIIKDSRLEGLQGLSVQAGRVHAAKGLEAEGPVLITHWGLSGPAILRVSAWGARQLQEMDYHFVISVNWCGNLQEKDINEKLNQLRKTSPRQAIANDPQFNIPTRLWRRLIECTEIGTELRWPHLPRQNAQFLAGNLTDCRFKVTGKSMNKDEFVTCGGIHLDEINFKTMESRLVDKLYCAGEVLDIDGITGGFNFQAAWTTARIAGEAIAESISNS